jgi:nucleoside recognition membrane protein YjiH
LIGFADMFIPALLMGGIQSVETKFIVGVLSLIQIIYLTEVGAIAIKSEVPLNFFKLLIIFLERTIIAIPLIVLLSKVLLQNRYKHLKSSVYAELFYVMT